MPITYVRKDNPNEVLGTFSDEELGMKMSDTSGGYAGQTEKERIESLGWVAKNTENKKVPPPEKPAGTTGTEGTTGEGTTGEKTGGDSNNDAINAQKGLVDFYQSQYDRLQTEFDNYTKDIAEIDSENNPMIQDIKATFERRKAEMAKLNQSMQGQLGLTQGRTGMSRYAPETAQGFISAEITNGMNRLSELESQKLAAIQEAKRALKSDAEDKWRTFNEMMNAATKAYENKVTAVKDLHNMIKQEENAVLEKAQAEQQQQQQASRDSAVADLMAQGVTDVTEMLNYLNFDESGEMVGDFTAEEVSKTMNLMANKDALAGLDSSLRTYQYLKENQPEELKAMGVTNYQSYLKSIALAKKTPTSGGGGSTPKQTPEQKAWEDDLSKALGALSANKNDWGKVWNYMYSRYKDTLELTAQNNPDEYANAQEVLDKYLNKEMFFPGIKVEEE